jgi:hypothetical protein
MPLDTSSFSLVHHDLDLCGVFGAIVLDMICSCDTDINCGSDIASGTPPLATQGGGQRAFPQGGTAEMAEMEATEATEATAETEATDPSVIRSMVIQQQRTYTPDCFFYSRHRVSLL